MSRPMAGHSPLQTYAAGRWERAKVQLEAF
jgi:hypothetical protein